MDGQTRSLIYIDDCLRGTETTQGNNTHKFINLRTNGLLTIGHPEVIAGVQLQRRYSLNGPKSPKNRNDTGVKTLKYLELVTWIRLRYGLEKAYV